MIFVWCFVKKVLVETISSKITPCIHAAIFFTVEITLSIKPCWISRAYFRKAGHACVITKKGHILINLEQFEDKMPLNSMQIKVFGVRKHWKKFQKGIVCGYCMQKASKVSPDFGVFNLDVELLDTVLIFQTQFWKSYLSSKEW